MEWNITDALNDALSNAIEVRLVKTRREILDAYRVTPAMVGDLHYSGGVGGIDGYCILLDDMPISVDSTCTQKESI